MKPLCRLFLPVGSHFSHGLFYPSNVYPQSTRTGFQVFYKVFFLKDVHFLHIVNVRQMPLIGIITDFSWPFPFLYVLCHVWNSGGLHLLQEGCPSIEWDCNSRKPCCPQTEPPMLSRCHLSAHLPLECRLHILCVIGFSSSETSCFSFFSFFPNQTHVLSCKMPSVQGFADAHFFPHPSPSCPPSPPGRALFSKGLCTHIVVHYFL